MQKVDFIAEFTTTCLVFVVLLFFGCFFTWFVLYSASEFKASHENRVKVFKEECEKLNGVVLFNTRDYTCVKK
jgi:hypothetical protein